MRKRNMNPMKYRNKNASLPSIGALMLSLLIVKFNGEIPALKKCTPFSDSLFR